MAIYSGVQIEGAKEFRRAARKAGIDMRDLRSVHKTAAGIVVTKAKTWAPRRTGKLADSIRGAGTQTAAIVRAGNNRKRGVPYANPIHWGWKKRGISANPFLSYSAQATESQWINVYYEKIEDTLDGFAYG